jgi:hypothetical protein
LVHSTLIHSFKTTQSLSVVSLLTPDEASAVELSAASARAARAGNP